ncbi:MAG: hypothetical protein UW69_C0061G0006 [Microgenomates group bacterium GW2011_GWA2_44_7]|nr:MAG: hypothetical protein UW69_C0061G0006 [Microgenomates group bacterium GW2011_GWA2_44_7]KKT78563.1 MAG: hypothetical protein UW73_C0001G0010 [Microgenomates group bacterium GW2011_GWB1_44_8]
MKSKLVILISAAIFLALPTSIMIYRWSSTPTDKVFAGTFGFSDDYNVMVHAVTQGVRGRWTVLNKFSSLPHPGSFFHEEYLLLGKIINPPLQLLFKVFKIPSYIPPGPIIFNLSRFLLAIILLWSIWEFIKAIVPENRPIIRLGAWLLSLFTGPLPTNIMSLLPSEISWITNTPYFREMNVVYRFNTMPHIQTGLIAMFLLLVLYLKVIRKNELRIPTYLQIFILTSLATWTDTVSAITAFLAITVFLFAWALFHNNRDTIVLTVLYLGSMVAAIIPSLIYFFQLRTQPVWMGVARYIQSQNPFSPASFFFLFPVLIPSALVFVIAIVILKKKIILPADSLYLLISWLFTFILLILFSDVIQINRLRLLRPPIFIPLAVLASYGVYSLLNYFSQTWSKALFSVFLILALYPSVFSIRTALNEEYQLLSSFSSIVYPIKTQVQAYDWLYRNTSENTIVAALYEAASLLPPLSGNGTLAGNVTEDPNDYREKSTKLTSFYGGVMNEEESKNYLLNERVSYIYWGPQERSLGKNLLEYPFLKRVYANPEVILLQVVP